MSSSLLFGVATAPDLLRLVAVPVFAWAAYRDLETRRVPNRIWLPLVVVGVLALAWDALAVLDAATFQRRLFAVQTLVSIGFVAPLGYVFWRIGGFGGADAKAIITLAVVFPAYPVYYLLGGAYPASGAPLGVFSFTILSNTVVLGLLYPLALAVRNLPNGEITPAMFVGRPLEVSELPREYGRLLETTAGFTRRGLDIDALRMYLRWRGASLEEVRTDPDRFRESAPAEPNDPGDGSIGDGGTTDAGFERTAGDPWGVEAFCSDHDAYGTRPADLREGLETLVEPERKRIWITPGIPFIVPMFVGLVLAITVGDLMFGALTAAGLV